MSAANHVVDYTITLTDAVTAEMEKAIATPLTQYNMSQAGLSGARALAILIKDADEQIIGGLWGKTGGGWLFTQLFVIPESLRGQGLGTKLLHLAEQEAIERGCHGAWLDTFEFQARAFYERLGYSCFGQLEDYPMGFSRFFMKKSLRSQ
ncbi:GNAT family N-acetyltransferase [Aquirhabdus sp.]|uniref:GNAT family N-acetyltransferase n=1 Tax=Aquirhabdus sp. TaxID=2824160 RepID=UPI00396C3A6A